MMRYMGACACALVAFDCLAKATGEESQMLFSHDAIWLWWVTAAYWFFWAFKFAFMKL
jgi:hypothetical protein